MRLAWRSRQRVIVSSPVLVPKRGLRLVHWPLSTRKRSRNNIDMVFSPFFKVSFVPWHSKTVIEVTLGSPVALTWHSKLNQLFVGMSSGAIHGFYDVDKSHKGVLLGVSKEIKKPRIEDIRREGEMYPLLLFFLQKMLSFT